MSIIVDGYNYIGRSRTLKLHDPGSRDRLISLMGEYCRKAGKSLTIVFDGNYSIDQANRKRRYGRVTVIYTSPIYTADDLIKTMVRKQAPGRRKGLLIVSSDEDILRYTASHGVATVRAETFERTVNQTLAADPEFDRTHVRLSEEEVQKWLKIFATAESKQEAPESRGRPAISRKKADSGLIAKDQECIEEPGQKKDGEQEPHAQLETSGRKYTKKRDRKSSGTPASEEVDRIYVNLSKEEVQEWLKIFGEDEEEE